jgi:hypothetical protein
MAEEKRDGFFREIHMENCIKIGLYIKNIIRT